MDAKDRQIIRALQQNGRMTNQELAAKVNLSPSPCLRRLKMLEASGAIRGYTAEADPTAYGLPVTVFVRIRLERHNAEDVKHFESRVLAMDEVLECVVMTGATDYQLRVVVSGLDAYEDFIRHRIHPIGCIASIESSFVYGFVKKTGVFPRVD
ncbi:Lrp/AsnC family transcriptional regulator [Roseibium denhamense]|uniref:Transcriptional regulator, AsnC family n=1 Tax=Roseibium denhamense TaxID=76305 RepID=A0ABY1P5R4_9HYPH|nr:Lrp/AsnC family transcriptional regulator [Roseibium denhamense]MTI04198.1 Lrp/AsnC family transcriptional regulator [Roseibium denhamense]SMP25515.1 transcriptional regulator, AsnC family [Roseibium denhamense]